MLLYPPVSELAEKVGSRYELVNVIAKRARHISAEYEESGEPLDEKPVSIAIQEVYAGKLTVNHEKNAQAEAEEES
ncbi:MAG: DNA-directed RNA polymerase subunit omega [Oscillospiraceae bacterium]|nr:DNA-directed RNA polymerase subunit omega [Oscillospiraceae bacterium]